MSVLIDLLNTLKDIGVKLNVNDKKELVVKGDKNALDQSLVNLITNYKHELIGHLIHISNRNNYIGISKRTSSYNLLSFAQQRLWLLDKIDADSVHYNMPGALRLTGDLDVDALTKAINTIVERHESLRTHFAEGAEGQPLQIIRPFSVMDVPITDISLLPEGERELDLAELVSAEANKPFDLSADLMLRAQVVKVQARAHVLLVTMHHVASDGWSMGILINEFSTLYSAYVRGEANPLPALEIQYADYAHWQRDWLQGEVLDEQLGYWQAQLAALPVVHSLPLDKTRPKLQTFSGASHHSIIPASISVKLNNLCQGVGATLFMGLHAAFSVLLARYSNETDIVVGSPIANREQAEVANLIGFFVNTLVLRSDLSDNPSFSELLEQSKQMLLDAYAHQQVPFEQIVESLNPERSMAHSPLFQVMLVLQNNEKGTLELPDLTLSPVEQSNDVAQYDLTLNVTESESCLHLGWEYNTDLFNAETIERLAKHFDLLLTGLVNTPEENVFSIEMLPAAEVHQQLIEWNDTAADFPKDKCIHELFEQQVQENPEAIAVVFEGSQLTYGELNAKANQLAHYLIQERGVTPDTLVGLCVERSLDVIVGIMGILKAGGAYVPLDPSYPTARLEYMLDDANLTTVLTQEKIKGETPVSDAQAVYIDSKELLAQLQTHATENIAVDTLTSSHLTYVIYTSGSTGNPKGVMVEHSGLVNMTQCLIKTYQLSHRDKLLQFAPISFDMSVEEIFTVLSCGAQLVVRTDKWIESSSAFWALCRSNAISVLNLPTAYWHELTKTDLNIVPSSLRHISVGGDKIESSAITSWFNNCVQPIVLMNAYGATEVTVNACISHVSVKSFKNIGKALDNLQTHVLSTEGHCLPVGISGELHIGGVGLARGYLNQAELTAEKFIANPFFDKNNPNSSNRLYKTGDLVRYLPDGNLEFLGRIDHQVKIRGFRIELGEIEHQLLTHDDVNDAVVVALSNEEGDKRLVGYVTHGDATEMLVEGDEAQALRTELIDSLRNELSQALPDYMVPSAFVVLESLPLTPNGKVNRKALPAPDMSLQQKTFVAPTTETEEMLCEIWQEVLGIERVGITDNFFELGGHSLLVMQVISKVQRTGFELTAKEFFSVAQLLDLANILDNKSDKAFMVYHAPENLIPASCDVITPEMLPLITLTQKEINLVASQVPGGAANIEDIYPLGPLQEGILFTHMMSQQSDPYVIPMMFEFSEKQVLDDFISALQFLVSRHDVLRTAILWEGVSVPLQVVCRAVDLLVKWLAPTDDALAEMTLLSGNKMDLGQAPLLQIHAVQDLNSERYIVLLQLHHIISDHVGLEIIQKELSQYLQGGSDTLLPSLPYREFIAHTLAQSKQNNAKEFFSDLLGDVEEPSLPFNLTDVQGDGSTIIEQRSLVPVAISAEIRRLSKTLKISPASVFHSAYGMLIASCSGREDVVFGTVMSGRLQGLEGAERMLGVFINTLPLRTRIKGKGVRDYVSLTHKLLQDLLPFEQTSLAFAQSCSALSNDTPLFSAMLNYRHSHTNEETTKDEATNDSVIMLSAKERTNYPFTLNVDDLGSGFSLDFQLDSSIDIAQVMSYMQQALKELVHHLQYSPESLVETLSILPAEEVHLQLVEWNDTAADFPQDKCIHELFEAQVEINPDAIAVVFEDKQLTYGELNAKANQLARYLIEERQITPDTLVGICIERSLDMIVGIMAILKAGGAYVPLEPSYPKARLEYMLADASLSTVLTQSSLQGETPVTQAQSVHIDSDELLTQLQGYPADNVTVQEQNSNNLAYVIYTSGSTGNPKGVMVEHQALYNRIDWMHKQYGCTPQDKILQKTPFSFDVSVWEFFWPLSAGAKLVFAAPEGHKDVSYLTQLIQAQDITKLHFVPSMLTSMLTSNEFTKCYSLRQVFCSGEALQIQHVESFSSVLPETELHNLYGPTEAAIDVSYWDCKQNNSEIVPIGKPIDNIQLYILSRALNVQPIGVPGELHIGGVGLARGYLNQAELTDEKFILNPFYDANNPSSSERLYKTGDLVCWLPDGNLEFLGRIDHQVKIRGFRIELGEIEHQLLSHDEVNDAVVVASEHKEGDKRLVAYVTHDDADKMLLADDSQTRRHDFIESLRQQLANDLPDYMVPSVFVVLENLPLTPNGKVDRKALPAPDLSLQQKTYVAPTTETEEVLCELWQAILGVERVGVTDNFFELGGHSLLITKLLIEINKTFDINLSMKQVFTQQTVSELYPLINSERTFMNGINANQSNQAAEKSEEAVWEI
ncbi:MAG: amino acid adenylation domain-containing protein [Alteromonadaceae bacterium]|nr:amino acid adenylation domain-containing protein [Alteromonadaceae bacterium]